MSDRSTPLRDALRRELADALRRRDRGTVSVCRTALAALANAEAVPADTLVCAGAVEDAPAGVGTTKAVRRPLTAAQEQAVIDAEIRERLDAASLMATSAPLRAERLRSEAALLARLAD